MAEIEQEKIEVVETVEDYKKVINLVLEALNTITINQIKLINFMNGYNILLEELAKKNGIDFPKKD